MTIKIYRFGQVTEGNASMKNVLGGKGANLAEMCNLGFPVPPGFTIPCQASIDSITLGFTKVFNEGVDTLITEGYDALVGEMGMPPLMSVRSGARVSMPGMMDTILNVGLTTETLPFWKDRIGERAALDSYRRLIQMYGTVAMGVPAEDFDNLLVEIKETAGVDEDSKLTPSYLTRLVKRYKELVEACTGKEFPDTTMAQMRGAVFAVFKSWMNPRAIEYRQINSIPEDWGTAVTIQAMVFGNADDKSCSGVMFTRDFSTGEPKVTGEYLVNAQGEEVVVHGGNPMDTMQMWNPMAYGELMTLSKALEAHYKDMQDIEFTVQSGKLYLLQTRNGKRSAKAAFRVAYDLVMEGVISQQEAALRVNQEQLFAVLQDTIDPAFTVKPDGVGIAAGGGLATGQAVFKAADAVNCTGPCILVTHETHPDDIGGMNASLGILTASGGTTSHAAVVARGMNKACVVGTTSMTLTGGGKVAHLGGKSFAAGDTVTIDGSTGNIWVMVDVPVIPGGADKVVKTVVGWLQSEPVADRIELHAAMKPGDIMKAVKDSTADVIQVDTVKLEGPDRYLKNPSETLSRVKALGAALVDSKAKRIIVNVTSRKDHYGNGDGVFDFMFGADTSNAVESKVMETIVKTWWPDTKVLFVVSGRVPGASALRKAGFKVLGSVETFADLLEGSTTSITEETIAKIFGTKEAYEIARQMIEAKYGKKVGTTIPQAKYWYDPMTQKGA